MKWGITFLGEWREMEKKMDLVWENLFKEDLEGKGEESFRWVEKLPKSEGTGRASSRSRSKKHIKSV